MASEKEKQVEKPLTLDEAIEALKEAEKLIKEPAPKGGIPVSPPPEDTSGFLTPKAELCARIVRVAKMGLEKYYKRFPDRENDQRAIDAVFWSMAGLRTILLTVDDYEISAKKDRVG